MIKNDKLRVKLYRAMRIGSLLAWGGLFAVLPDVDHLVDGVARQTHLPFLLAMVVLSGIVFYLWCFKSLVSGRFAVGDVN